MIVLGTVLYVDEDGILRVVWDLLNPCTILYCLISTILSILGFRQAPWNLLLVSFPKGFVLIRVGHFFI